MDPTWPRVLLSGRYKVVITVNGEIRDCEEGETLASFLEGHGLEAARVAVELNGKIVSRDLYSKTELLAGDRVEIVRFVGGG